MILAILVGIFGGVGALARYLADGAVQDRTSGAMPFGTLSVNVIGSLLRGVVSGLALSHAGTSTLRTIVGTGFCGGLTTWSTASWETVRLVEEDLRATAVVFTLANLAASVAAGALGLLLVQL